MANLASHYSVVVIDEIQMIADSGRGWAWTAALLGLQADEIHLCGEPTAIEIVRKMMESAYDDVEIRQYDRLNKLEVEPVSLGGSYQNVKPGDCVVAFSRQEIFSVKNRIEKATGMKCAVITTRAEQARLFNDPESGYDVIVASDAIGMGINLNIKRVVFSTVTKFDGRETLPIGLSMLRQIGGRAGRYGRSDGIGTVTAFEAEDLPAVKSGMATSPPGIARAGWKPDNIDISEAIESVPLTVPERYLFMMAPCPKQVEGSRETIAQFARDRYEGRPCEIDNYVKLPETLPKTNKELKQVESMHKIVLMYMWLHFYFPDTFTTFERAAELKGLIEKQIVDGLQQLPTSRKQARGKKSLEEIL
ncbi:hypothetical protein GQ42DRAFT_167766 [Ramicandelaber brevisporus]|nr:hypothetical protein GQ42DRAFT_167766 [Ramicandelaber brevisporus]